MQNELNGEKHIVDAFQSDKRGTRWPFILIVLGVALCILAVVFDFFDVERKYTDVFFALLLIGLAVLVVSAIAILIVNGKSMSIKGKVITIVFLLVVSAPLVYLGVRPFQEEKVYDAFYDAEEVVTQKLGMEYEMQHMDDLPFYTGEKSEIIVYANGEDSGQPFDRLWIYPCTTESEAIEVLDDFEAYLGDGVEWRRDDEALFGKEAPTDFGKYLISAIPRFPWQRNLPDLEIRSHFTEDSGPFAEKTEVNWYARRYKTMVLIMDKVRYEYEIDGETYGATPEEWEAEKTAFDDFFENNVDTDVFWE